MLEAILTDLPAIKAPELSFEQLKMVLKRLRPLQRYSFCVEACEEGDAEKLRAGFLKLLKGYLSLEEVVALYSASVGLFLLAEDECEKPCNQRLELLNETFGYSDTLKPTMIHYATVEMLSSIRLASSDEEHCFVHLLEALPHILVASDTGKMISLGLLRALIATISGCQIILHIYRSVWEIWEMLNQISHNSIMLDWSLRRTYIFVKAFAMLIATAAFNSCNAELKQAGYRGFDLPPKPMEIAEWFKTLRDRLEEKHKELKCLEGIMLVRFMDHNILAYLTDTGNESTSEVGNEAASEAANYKL
ncbi:uncharacterized protein LOC128266668 isoform X1 [Drosophila gunungcola]|uniref:uncharacterized protein LOC128266668 isoform X1 n=1 Tax=Drosophila gunungcola TaxID=103775 RepID=UPI0022E6D2C9|nr:uncharacterized protein LOC128266668 isoform X1 [Drosophila gunungcola]